MKKQKKKSLKRGKKSGVKGPKALFWYLTLFFTLGITAFATGGLWFQFINKWFSKEIIFGQVVSPFSQTALKWQMAALLIAAPVYFLLSSLVRKALKTNELKADNKVRLWITYIILFVAVAAAVGDLITATFRLLNGDYTTRFLLKCLVILVVVAWVFSYYWLEIKSPKTLNDSSLPKIMGVISLVAIIVSFLGTFLILESPLLARQKAADRTRVANLQEIKYAIDDYYREYQKLPATLDDLRLARGYIKITDLKTGMAFDYQPTGAIAYRLCAEFDGENKTDSDDYKYYPSEFLHDAGRNCFDRQVSQIEKQIPPPRPAPVPAE